MLRKYINPFVFFGNFRQLEKSEYCEFGCYTKVINNYNGETGEIEPNNSFIERGCNKKKGVSLQAGCKVCNFWLDVKIRVND